MYVGLNGGITNTPRDLNKFLQVIFLHHTTIKSNYIHSYFHLYHILAKRSLNICILYNPTTTHPMKHAYGYMSGYSYDMGQYGKTKYKNLVHSTHVEVSYKVPVTDTYMVGVRHVL